MSVELDRESPGKFDSRTLSRKTLNRWTGRNQWIPGWSVLSGSASPGFRSHLLANLWEG